MKKTAPGRQSLPRIAVGMASLLLIVTSSARAIAQEAPAPKSPQESSTADLLKLPGKVLGEGENKRPVGQFKLLTYRVEEVQLPATRNVEVRGQRVEVDKAWRITITGGPFPVRNLPAVIWVDDQVVGVGVENERLSGLTAITFDSSLLHEGSTISLSYGEDKDARVKLPEKFSPIHEN
jgi:hypothetical protein